MERSAIHLLCKRGKSLRAIAAELGHSTTTIARALSEPVDQPSSRRPRVSLVDPWRSQIAEWLRQGLSGVRMLELARDDPEQPYRGCDSVWRAAGRRERLVWEHEQAVADVPIRVESLPGEYLQVDWGEVRHFPFTHQSSRRRYFLACRPKYSRWVWVRFTSDMRQETLFRGLVDCFNALGFVPWVLVFDNMKTVTTGRDDQEQPIWHRSLLQGVIDPEHERSIRSTGGDQQAQHDAAGVQAGPLGSAEHPVVAAELFQLSQPQHPQRRRDRPACPGSAQPFGPLPSRSCSWPRPSPYSPIALCQRCSRRHRSTKSSGARGFGITVWHRSWRPISMKLAAAGWTRPRSSGCSNGLPRAWQCLRTCSAGSAHWGMRALRKIPSS
jgi:transposase